MYGHPFVHTISSYDKRTRDGGGDKTFQNESTECIKIDNSINENVLRELFSTADVQIYNTARCLKNDYKFQKLKQYITFTIPPHIKSLNSPETPCMYNVISNVHFRPRVQRQNINFILNNGTLQPNDLNKCGRAD